MAQKWSSSKSDTGRVMSSSILALGLVFPKTALFREETPGKQVKKKKGFGLNFGHSHSGTKPNSKTLKDSKHRETFPQICDKRVRHPELLRCGHPGLDGS